MAAITALIACRASAADQALLFIKPDSGDRQSATGGDLPYRKLRLQGLVGHSGPPLANNGTDYHLSAQSYLPQVNFRFYTARPHDANCVEIIKMSARLRIGMIRGSARESGFGDTIAALVEREMAAHGAFEVTRIDPRAAVSHEPSALQRSIDRTDGFVVVTPEYNHEIGRASCRESVKSA